MKFSRKAGSFNRPSSSTGSSGSSLITAAASEKSTALPGRHTFRIVDSYPFHAATGGVFLKNVAGEIERRKSLHSFGGEGIELRSPVFAGPLCNHSRFRRIANEANGLAGNSHDNLYLRTDRYPLNVAAECLGEEAISLVAAVIADFFTQ